MDEYVLITKGSVGFEVVGLMKAFASKSVKEEG
jgi:hypothetical protein